MSMSDYILQELASDTLKAMQDNNSWFISVLVDLEREALNASLELEQHRQSMRDRETIMTKLKEMAQ